MAISLIFFISLPKLAMPVTLPSILWMSPLYQLDVYPPVALAPDAGFGPAISSDVVAADRAVELLP